MTRPSLQEDWVSSPANNLDIVFSWIDFNCSSAPLQPCNDQTVECIICISQETSLFISSCQSRWRRYRSHLPGRELATEHLHMMESSLSGQQVLTLLSVQDRYLVSSSHHLTNDKHCLWDHHRQPPPEHRDNTRNVQIVRTVDIDSNNGD